MQAQWAEWTTQAMNWVGQSGWVGWIGFIALYTFTCVFFLPGSMLTVGAGAIYGFWGGTALVSISSMAGAAANFLTSRYLLRGWLTRKFAASRRFHALDHAIATDGWKVILLSRISPILPHSLVSYAAGLSRISLTKYSLASWIGFIPISAAYAYAGAFLGKFARAQAGADPRGDTWLFYAIGLAVTVIVTVWSTRVAGAAMRAHVEDEPAADG